MPVDKPNILQDDSFEEDAVFALRPPQEAVAAKHGPRGSHFAPAVSSAKGAQAALSSTGEETAGEAGAARASAQKQPDALEAAAGLSESPISSHGSEEARESQVAAKPATPEDLKKSKDAAHKALTSLPSFDDEEEPDPTPTPVSPASAQAPLQAPVAEPEADAAKKPSVLDATGPGPRALHIPVAEKAAMAKVEARSPHAVSGSPKSSSAKSSSKASKKKAQIKKYSRYNRRYLDRDQLKASAEGSGSAAESKGVGFVLLSDNGLAFSWLPFLVYGGVAALACAAWCVVARVLTAAPLIPGDMLLTVGLILLCVIVVAGLVLAGIAAKLTLDEDGAETFDVFSSVIGKTAIAMVAAIVVWVICMAVATML